jgi:hypothetical protein
LFGSSSNGLGLSYPDFISSIKAPAIKNFKTGVLGVLSGTQSKGFPPALTANVELWKYLEREKDDFLLTSEDTCLVEETTCRAADGKGWNTLVSDHYPVYVDIEL